MLQFKNLISKDPQNLLMTQETRIIVQHRFKKKLGDPGKRQRNRKN